MRPEVDERPLTPSGPFGVRGLEGRPKGVGLASARARGGPAAEFCCYRVTEYSADGGRSGLLYDPLLEGEGPYPKGARLRASPGRAR